MEVTTTLRKVIPGFDYLRLKEAGEGKILLARFNTDEEYKLDELSDGQRMLIVTVHSPLCKRGAGGDSGA